MPISQKNHNKHPDHKVCKKYQDLKIIIAVLKWIYLTLLPELNKAKKYAWKKKKKKNANNMAVRAATNKCREILIELP